MHRYAKQRVTINNQEWTPIVPTQPYDFFSFRCPTSDLVFRTIENDPITEDSLSAGMQEGVIVGSGTRNWYTVVAPQFRTEVYNQEVRFPSNVPICWVKSSEPSAIVIVTWIL